MIEVKVKRVLEKPNPLPFPQYHSSEASGIDLMADIDRPVVLEPGQRGLVPTGIAIELPKGYEAQIRPRSGLAIKKGISLVNAPGTIDSDYRGEIRIILINLGHGLVKIERGDRIAQMVIAPVTRASLVEVEDLNSTNRSSGGFGSTGHKTNC